jgi:hypothetical protein
VLNNPRLNNPGLNNPVSNNPPLSPQILENLAGSLVWRVGRLTEEAPLTIRIGLASSVSLFNELPKLRTATDAEVDMSIKAKDFRIEWIGRMP